MGYEQVDGARGLLQPQQTVEVELEERATPRFTLLIRAATLVTASGEFVCVLRDVSETGVSVRLFHRPPTGDPVELHMPVGEIYQLRLVWERNQEAGYEFAAPGDVARLINEAGQ